MTKYRTPRISIDWDKARTLDDIEEYGENLRELLCHSSLLYQTREEYITLKVPFGKM
jgi:hypothetical protein